MSLLKTIKVQQLQARKDRDRVKASLLTTLIGDAEKVGKDNGDREPTDEEVQRTIKKFLTNGTETLNAIKTTSGDVTQVSQEIEILTGLLPTQLTDAELEQVVQATIAKVGATSMKDMGKVMAVLKTDHAGTYDGKVANGIVKRLLTT
jgi:uncharacterized protein YqeY